MPDLLVSTSTGAMGSLLMKLASMLTDRYKALKHVRSDIETLKKELEFMQAFLLTMANVEEPNEQDRLRVRDVRELSYDIEDQIDKFIVLVNSEPNTKQHGFFNTITDKCKNLITEMKTRYQIAKEVKSILNQVMETSQRYNRYKTEESFNKTRNMVVDSRVLAFFKDAPDELVGIDGPRDELINLLMHNEDESTQKLKIVSVVGFGGLGKTTLASQVYRSLGANFDCRAFVSISQNPDMTKILSSILSEISNYKIVAGGAQEIIIRQIKEFLQDKRYFIIVDDIWDIHPSWEILECAFAKNSCGSRIMITTRILGVARSCSSSSEDLVYHIKPLSCIDSKRLFFKRIFGCEEKCPPYLKGAADEILKRCGGLPLAVIAVSSLLAIRPTNDLWDRVRKSIGFAFGKSSEVDGMRAILSLSYFELPYHLRSCLLYLALFPEDYEIDRHRLVHRWIAEGFIHSEDGQDLVELGDTYFHELINRSLVQPSKIWYDGKAEGCRVHDTILDFLVHESTEENFCTVLRNHPRPPYLQDTKIRRLSLLRNGNNTHVNIYPELNGSHLRSLGVFNLSIKQEIPSVMDFSHLRVLDLKGCLVIEGFLKINIGKLHQLRYLNVADTDIRELPPNIGTLQYLETLDVANTLFLYELPETIIQLKRLARLFVSYNARLPDGIGNLKNLQVLGDIDYSICSLNFLHGLGELIELRDLTIRYDTTKIKGDRACHLKKLMSFLRKLEACKLRNVVLELILSTNDCLEGDTFPALNSIHRLTFEIKSLKECKIITTWLASLFDLQYLDIKVGEIEQQDLELIGSIPALLYFRLNIYSSISRGPPLIIRGGFHQLQKFCFASQSEGFKVEPGAMVKLKDLELWINLVNFKSRLGGLDFGVYYLSSLSTISLHLIPSNVRDKDVKEDLFGVFKNMVEEHTNRPTLEVQGTLL